MNEKERVYQELDRTRAKCLRLRQEVRAMHEAFDESAVAALRAEKDGYKMALSNIAHRLDTEGEIDIKTLRSIVDVALAKKNLKAGRRRLIARHDGEVAA